MEMNHAAVLKLVKAASHMVNTADSVVPSVTMSKLERMVANRLHTALEALDDVVEAMEEEREREAYEDELASRDEVAR